MKTIELKNIQQSIYPFLLGKSASAVIWILGNKYLLITKGKGRFPLIISKRTGEESQVFFCMVCLDSDQLSNQLLHL